MSSRFRLAPPLGALLSVLLLALVACGGGSSSGDMSGTPGMSGGSSGTSATGGAPAQTVHVTLSDFKVSTSQTTFKTGVLYHFVVSNSDKSSANHEFMIVKPMNGDGMTMDEMDKMALYMVDQHDLPPGATKRFDLTFKDPAAASQLEFACHVGSHYQLGMHESITVTPA